MSEMKMLADLVPGKGPLLGTHINISFCIFPCRSGERKREALLSLLIRAPIPIHEHSNLVP